MGVTTLEDKVAAVVAALSPFAAASVVVTRSQRGHMVRVDAGSGSQL